VSYTYININNPTRPFTTPVRRPDLEARPNWFLTGAPSGVDVQAPPPINATGVMSRPQVRSPLTREEHRAKAVRDSALAQAGLLRDPSRTGETADVESDRQSAAKGNDDDDGDGPVIEPPGKNAPKAVWVAFAKAVEANRDGDRWHTDDELGQLTVAELQQKYGVAETS